MGLERIIFICFVIGLVVSEKHRSENGVRKRRYFTFDTVDDDVKINLEFEIPFLTIPVKKSMNAFFGSSDLPTININPSSLLLGGLVVFGSSIMLPLLLKNYGQCYPQKRYSKFLDHTEFGVDNLLDFSNRMLTESKELHGCPLRVACWAGQRIIDEQYVDMFYKLVSNEILSSVVNVTALEDARRAGVVGHDCLSYSPCPLREEHVLNLLHHITVIANP